MIKIKDITNIRFGRLTVISLSNEKDKSGRVRWNCLCDCGNMTIGYANDLQSGKKKSCGCLKMEQCLKTINKVNINHPTKTHGLSRTRIYAVWSHMVDRCINPNTKCYKNYGGRGIKVCDEWLDSSNFFRDMLPTYKDDLTLDRIDVDGNYCKENCRWATYKEQGNNRRNNHLLEYRGEILNIGQWAKKLGIKRKSIDHRIKSGYSIEDILSTNYVAKIPRNEKPKRWSRKGFCPSCKIKQHGDHRKDCNYKY